MDIQNRLAELAKGKSGSAIRELMKYMKIDGMISLGGGYPDPDTFVFESVQIKFKGGQQIEIDGEELTVASQYGPSDANTNLRKELQGWHTFNDGVDLKDDQIVVLNSCQEGLFIMANLFANHDDCVILSEPNYPGTLAAFRSFTKNFAASNS